MTNGKHKLVGKPVALDFLKANATVVRGPSTLDARICELFSQLLAKSTVKRTAWVLFLKVSQLRIRHSISSRLS